MQIARIEVADPREFREIEHGDGAWTRGHETIMRKVLQNPIDLNGRKAQRIADVGQPQRSLIEAVGAQADRIEPQRHLAKQMGDAFMGRAPTEIEHPGAEDRTIGDDVAPERMGQAEAMAREVVQAGVGDIPDGGRSQGGHAEVHGLEMQSLQIGDIARGVK